MSKRKNLLIYLLVALTIIFVNFSPATNNLKQKNKFYLFIGGGVNWTWDANICKISNIPERVRDVPVYPDDENIYTDIAPINNSQLSYSPSSVALNGVIGAGCKFGLYSIALGGSIDYYLAANDKTTIKRRNYTNAPGTEQKGEGAALTYYKLDKDWNHGLNALAPGLFVKLSKQFSEKSICCLFVEYNISFYGLHLENGWDRYNHLKKWKIYKIADIHRNSIKLGLGIKSLEIFVKYTISTTRLTELGSISNLKTFPYWTIGFSLKDAAKTK